MDIDVIVERKSFDVELEVGNPVVEVKAPDHYNGPFDIFPSDEDQIIPVKEKMPVEDICVKGITGEKTITQNGTYNTLEDKTVTVDVLQRFTLQTIADRSALKNLGEITISVPQVTQNMFNGWTFETIHLPDTVRINNYFPFANTGIKYIDMPNVEELGNTFYGLHNFLGTYEDGDGVVKLKKATNIEYGTFYSCDNIRAVYFYKKAKINSAAFRASGVRDIYVPWSEGEVAGAPWEANNATIHYDTVYDEDGNVVSST